MPDVLWCDAVVFHNHGSKKTAIGSTILSQEHQIFDRGNRFCDGMEENIIQYI